MKQNPDDFAGFVIGSFDDHLREMSCDKTWGGHLELMALSRALGANITVHQLHSPRYDILASTSATGATPNKVTPTLHVSYHNGEHYNSVRHILDDTAAPVGSAAAQRHLIVLPSKQPASGGSGGSSSSKSAAKNESKEDRALRVVKQQTGCDDEEMVLQVLEDVDWDIDAAVELVVNEMNMPSQAEREQSALVDGLSSLSLNDNKDEGKKEKKYKKEKKDKKDKKDNGNCSSSRSNDKKDKKDKKERSEKKDTATTLTTEASGSKNTTAEATVAENVDDNGASEAISATVNSVEVVDDVITVTAAAAATRVNTTEAAPSETVSDAVPTAEPESQLQSEAEAEKATATISAPTTATAERETYDAISANIKDGDDKGNANEDGDASDEAADADADNNKNADTNASSKPAVSNKQAARDRKIERNRAKLEKEADKRAKSLAKSRAKVGLPPMPPNACDSGGSSSSNNSGRSAAAVAADVLTGLVVLGDVVDKYGAINI